MSLKSAKNESGLAWNDLAFLTLCNKFTGAGTLNNEICPVTKELLFDGVGLLKAFNLSLTIGYFGHGHPTLKYVCPSSQYKLLSVCSYICKNYDVVTYNIVVSIYVEIPLS